MAGRDANLIPPALLSICASASARQTVATLLGTPPDFGRLIDPVGPLQLGATLLLLAALIADPGGLVGHGKTGGLHHPLYLATGVLGSVWAWWSAIQGIRQRDFTADIPVSIAAWCCSRSSTC